MAATILAPAESRCKGHEVLVAGTALQDRGGVADGLARGRVRRSGPALVDSSTTRPVPTTTTSATATTRPGTTAVPTTGAIPTTTGLPVTTGQTGPAGAPLTFRRLTIPLGRGWRAGGGGDHVEVATSRACRRSAGRVDCPGFLLLGPSQIAIASELAPTTRTRSGTRAAGWRAAQDRDGLAEVTPSKPAKRGVAKVGGKDAVYREWRVDCVDARTGEPEASYTQRVWYLKASRILVVDEWSTPGLATPWPRPGSGDPGRSAGGGAQPAGQAGRLGVVPAAAAVERLGVERPGLVAGGQGDPAPVLEAPGAGQGLVEVGADGQAAVAGQQHRRCAPEAAAARPASARPPPGPGRPRTRPAPPSRRTRAAAAARPGGAEGGDRRRLQPADGPHPGPGGGATARCSRLQRPMLGHAANHPPALVQLQRVRRLHLAQRREGGREQPPPTGGGDPGGDVAEGVDEAEAGQDPGD